MSAAQHTPGPWAMHPDRPDTQRGKRGGYLIRPADRSVRGFTRGFSPIVVVDCDRRMNPVETNRANAALIAAAPELLEALIHCSTDEGAEQEWLDRARQAIAKATGSAA